MHRTIFKAICFLASAYVSNAYTFTHENTSYQNSHIPTLFNFTDSQYDVAVGSSSYWLTSFVTGDNDKQYLAVLHILTSEVPSIVCRSSVLDLETLEYWVDLTYCSRGNETLNRSGPLNIDYGTYGFGSTSDDGVSTMFAYANTTNSFSLDLSWESNSKALLNGGSGVIGFADWPSNATEWGIPAGKTYGNIILNDTTIEINPENSLSWYDRQISFGVPKNWTWFEVHFEDSPLKASVWILDEPEQRYEFATVRDGEEMHIIAFTLEPDTSKTWVSPKSNFSYPLSWKLKFENGDYLQIDSIRPDQEMFGSRNLGDSAYEGFVRISGEFQGQKKGFGVVEMVTIYE